MKTTYLDKAVNAIFGTKKTYTSPSLTVLVHSTDKISVFSYNTLIAVLHDGVFTIADYTAKGNGFISATTSKQICYLKQSVPMYRKFKVLNGNDFKKFAIENSFNLYL